jgi:hypothetical protein
MGNLMAHSTAHPVHFEDFGGHQFERLFVYLLRTGIRFCGRDIPDCPLFMIHLRPAEDMDRLRGKTQEVFRSLHPPIDVRIGWGDQ